MSRHSWPQVKYSDIPVDSTSVPSSFSARTPFNDGMSVSPSISAITPPWSRPPFNIFLFSSPFRSIIVDIYSPWLDNLVFIPRPRTPFSPPSHITRFTISGSDTTFRSRPHGLSFDGFSESTSSSTCSSTGGSDTAGPRDHTASSDSCNAISASITARATTRTTSSAAAASSSSPIKYIQTTLNELVGFESIPLDSSNLYPLYLVKHIHNIRFALPPIGPQSGEQGGHRCHDLPNESMHDISSIIPLLVRGQPSLGHVHVVSSLFLVRAGWSRISLLINITITPEITL